MAYQLKKLLKKKWKNPNVGWKDGYRETKKRGESPKVRNKSAHTVFLKEG